MLLGYHAGTSRADIFRSHIEGATFNLKQCLDIFDEIVPGGLQRILLGGGGTKVGIWPQIIADVFGRDMDIVANTDASSAGAAILGGYGAGILQDMQSSARKALVVKETANYSKDQHRAYQSIYKRYKQAYNVLSPLCKEGAPMHES
jgi:sugar (pentulose or hexulose) kinase